MTDDAPLRLTALMGEMERPALLELLATMIGEMTTAGRARYEEADALDQLCRSNEAIHRLAGHLRDLCDPTEPVTTSRLKGIREQVDLLPSSRIAWLCSYANSIG